ncbi:hypothetical protein L596_024462 [Steinernema carpocapsae]|uniref:Uncharacterized protein n=1 Tax=Steinernema carpocapsae TaxID=34508 RepID=A0A4U5MHQ6_STECR|nr:hypothetical protein L596_024462 [Steinernema carpocapsae]
MLKLTGPCARFQLQTTSRIVALTGGSSLSTHSSLFNLQIQPKHFPVAISPYEKPVPDNKTHSQTPLPPTTVISKDTTNIGPVGQSSGQSHLFLWNLSVFLL